jgi:hypothetical protein
MALEKDPARRAQFSELKKCAFFDGLNWDDVLARCVRPRFRGKTARDGHLHNFDKEFTQEVAVDSATLPVGGPTERLKGFSFGTDGVIPLDEANDVPRPSLNPTTFDCELTV